MTTGDTLDEIAPDRDAPADDVLAVVAAQDPDGAPAALWAALADALAGTSQAGDASTGGPGATRSGVADGVTAATDLIQGFIDEGLLRVVVVDLGGIRRPDGSAPDGDQPLRAAVEAIGAKDPAVDVRYVGPTGSDGGSLHTVAELVGG